MNNKKPCVVIGECARDMRSVHDVVEYHARVDQPKVHHFKMGLAVDGRSTKASQQPRDEYTSWLLQHWLPWANLDY